MLGEGQGRLIRGGILEVLAQGVVCAKPVTQPDRGVPNKYSLSALLQKHEVSFVCWGNREFGRVSAFVWRVGSPSVWVVIQSFGKVFIFLGFP